MALPQERLQAFLDRHEGRSERFKVENDEQANWALRKLKTFDQQMKENTELAKAEIEKIEFWLATENDQLKASKEHFETLLQEYAENLRQSDHKFKSLNLPHGRFGFRRRQPKWNYDNEKVVESLEAHGKNDLIRIRKEPDKSAIKKSFMVKNGKAVNPDTGETLDGVTVEEQPDSFNVKVVD